jgi:hypothetical protein
MRFAALAASLVGSAVFAALIPLNVVFIALFAVCAILSAIGIWDLLQSKHSVRRNYPILAHIRFMLEKDQAGNSSIFSGERNRRHSVQSLEAGRRLSAREGRARQAAVRHPARHLRQQLRVDQSFDRSLPGRRL